jgi:hypothetical protein
MLLSLTGQAQGSLVCHELERELSIGRFGTLHVRDVYYIENTGESTMYALFVNVPLDVINVEVSDTLGQPFWDYSIRFFSDFAEVQLPPRYASGSSLKPGEKCSFVVAYSLPLKNYLKEAQPYGRFSLELPFPNFTMPVKNAKVSVKLPEGAKFVESSLPSPTLSTSHTGTLISDSLYLGDTNQLSLMVKYDYFIFWSAFFPTIWLTLAIGVIVLIVLAGRLGVKVVEIPIRPEVKDFTELYTRKLALYEEMETIERKWKEGKLSKHDYNVRMRAIRSRLKAAEGKIAPLKKKLRGLGGKFLDVMNRIDASETLIEAAKSDLVSVEAKFRRHAISKEVYLELSFELTKRIEKEKRKIESAITRLYE